MEENDIDTEESEEESSSGSTLMKKRFDRTYRVAVKIHDDDSTKYLKLKTMHSFEARCTAVIKMIELGYELTDFHVHGDPERFYQIRPEGVYDVKGTQIMECEDPEASRDIIFIIETGLAKIGDDAGIIRQMGKLGWE